MLAPERMRPDRPAGEAIGIGEQRGQRRGAGALADDLLDLEVPDDGLLDGPLGHGHDVGRPAPR